MEIEVIDDCLPDATAASADGYVGTDDDAEVGDVTGIALSSATDAIVLG